jgi:SNF2 family DNA or RNA helicase
MSLATDLRSSVTVRIRERGAQLYATGKVSISSGGPLDLAANVLGSQRYAVKLRREFDQVVGSCECAYFDSDGICKHIWAALMAADQNKYLTGAGGRRVRALIEDDAALEPPAKSIQPPRIRPAPSPPKPPQASWQQLLARAEFTNGGAGGSESWSDSREIYYVVQVRSSQWDSTPKLQVAIREPKKGGQWGKLKTARIPREAIARFEPADRDILVMLGGAPQPYDWANHDSIAPTYNLEAAATALVLERVCATGRCLLEREIDLPFEQLEPLRWDDGPAWQFRIHLERDGAAWLVRGGFTREQHSVSCAEPDLVLREGLMLLRGTVARYEGAGAHNWSALLRGKEEMRIPLADGEQFLLHILKLPQPPAIEWPDELRFTESTAEPKPRLLIEQRHRRRTDALCAFAAFDYDGVIVPFTAATSGIFNAENRVLLRRDHAIERGRLSQLVDAGFRPVAGEYGEEAHHHLLAKKLSKAVRDLIAAGWHVELDGRAFRKPVSHRADLTSGVDWFELRAEVDYGTAKAALPQLLTAFKQNSALVELSDGSWGMFPQELHEQYSALLSTGRLEDGHLRYSRSQTLLLDALLASQPAVQLDQVFVHVRERLRSFERIEPAEQPHGFTGELRDYQREGLAWMLFLQDLGFGGCLADDMGLGKTAQVLALLERRRQERESGVAVRPSLAVVPRSIVFNWKQEAARFTPALRVLDNSGADRVKTAAEFDKHDLVLTTYGMLRRDITTLKDTEFDYVILDESQAIKNGDSDTAKAARLLRASHRLAMSGTPIENNVGELFSLFEFLNPGMLGNSRMMSQAGLARNPDEKTRGLLSAAIRPYILRRTKGQVARELPERTEQTVYCELDGTERALYNELREHYRQALLGRVAEQGIAKSQIQILEALLRLRQAACHPGLLDAKRRQNGSAKTEALNAQLSEVLSEGHKALVFSQFTTLLAIVRQQLDRDGVSYEYLEGQTRDRQARVERFQSDSDCKLFLISLKAGGVGLNLTAAEYVFLLDPWWNPAVEAQAIDRTHRIGQTNRVFAYRLIARDTVEEKVLELQAHKRELADSIIRADASLVRDLKREDLEFLLS